MQVLTKMVQYDYRRHKIILNDFHYIISHIEHKFTTDKCI